MKSSQSKKKDVPIKQTKTLLDFFGCGSSQKKSGCINSSSSSSNSNIPVVKKVNCPGCSELVSEAQINWHLDQDCISRKSINRLQKKKRKSGKIKANKDIQKNSSSDQNLKVESEEKTNKKKRGILSDSDSDFLECNDGGYESPVLFDFPKDKSSSINFSSLNSSEHDVFVSASMVETQLHVLGETEDESIMSLWPTFQSSSPSVKAKSLSGLKVQVMLQENWSEDNINSSNTSKSRRSFDLTVSQDSSTKQQPFKLEHSHADEMLERDFVNEKFDQVCNVAQLVCESNNLNFKCETNIPFQANCVKPSQKEENTKRELISDTRHCSTATGNNGNSSDSSNDFEPQSQSFRTPIKQKRSHSSIQSASKCTKSSRSSSDSGGYASVRRKMSFSANMSKKNDHLQSRNCVNNSYLPEEIKNVSQTLCVFQNIPTAINDDINSVQPHNINPISTVNINQTPSANISPAENYFELPPIIVNTANSDSDSSDLYSPTVNKGIVTPVRTPSPSPCKSKAMEREFSTEISNNPFDKLLTGVFNECFKDAAAAKSCEKTATCSPNKHCLPASILELNNITLSPSIRNCKARFGLSEGKSPNKRKRESSIEVKSQLQCDGETSKSLGACRNLFDVSSVIGSNDDLKEVYSKQTNCNLTSPSGMSSLKFSAQTKSSPCRISSPLKVLPLKENSPSKSSFLNNSPSKRKKNGEQYRQCLGYYLENFLFIVDSVCACPADYKLFSTEEKDIISSFHNFSLSAKKLYVRLFQRNVKWKRVVKIDYDDICDKEDTDLYVKELCYAEYLHGEDKLEDLQEVLTLLSAEEVIVLCKDRKITTASHNKSVLISALLHNSKAQPTIAMAFSKAGSNQGANVLLMNRAKKLLGSCCLLNRSVRRVFLRMFTLYSMPRYDEDDETGQQHQLVTLLRVNMGLIKYPTGITTLRVKDIFRSREDLLVFEQCQELYSSVHERLGRQQWEEVLEACQLADELHDVLIKDQLLITHDASLPCFLRRYTSLSLLVYLRTCAVEAQQRLRRYDDAVCTLRLLLEQREYLQDYRGAWYDRLALNLDQHLRRREEALLVVLDALRDPAVRAGRRLSISNRGVKLVGGRQFDGVQFMDPLEAPRVIIEGRSFQVDSGGVGGFRRVFLRGDSDRHSGAGAVMACSVEELALGHYRDEGYGEGLHAEGSVPNSLFGILFWSALYDCSVPDAFRALHQAVPLDIDSEHFYLSRKKCIDDRVDEVSRMTPSEASEAVTEVWEAHSEERCIVNWDLFRGPEHVLGLLLSLSLPLVARMCDRLARDHRFTRSGFPDLVVWCPKKKVSRVVEVKGPNDRLSCKQTLWLDSLIRWGAQAEVCHVEAIGAKKMTHKMARKVSPAKKTSPAADGGDCSASSAGARGRGRGRSRGRGRVRGRGQGRDSMGCDLQQQQQQQEDVKDDDDNTAFEEDLRPRKRKRQVDDSDEGDGGGVR